MRKRYRYIAVLLMGLMLCLESACGSGGSSSSSDSINSPSMGVDSVASSISNSIMSVADSASGYKSGSTGSGAVYEESSVETTGNEMSDTANNSRKLIKDVDMTVETYEYTSLIEGIQNEVLSLGGYIENYSSYNENSESDRSAYMTIRVPAEHMDGLIDRIGEEGNVTSRNESIEDVTLTYTDLDSHKRMLQEEQERLFELLQQAEDIETVIALESRLTDVRYQIDSIESQLRVIDNQVSYSTLRLDVHEVERYTPQTEKGTWDRIRVGFTENLYKVGNGIKELFIGLVISLPIICVYACVIAIFIIVLMAIVKYSDKVRAKRDGQYKNRVTPDSTKVKFNPNYRTVDRNKVYPPIKEADTDENKVTNDSISGDDKSNQ